MPSLRSLLSGLAASVLLQGVSALPAAPAELGLVARATPVLPLAGASASLPAPAGALKFVALGRGVQNYSCSAAGAKGNATGAVASLFDLTPAIEASEDAANKLPALAVYQPVPAAGASFTIGTNTLTPLGNHYFDAKGTPVFDLSSAKMILYAAKLAAVDAPKDADAGPDKTSAVPWLQLGEKTAGYSSSGLNAVYRVVTAGGAAQATCKDANTMSVQYAAEYWFYA